MYDLFQYGTVIVIVGASALYLLRRFAGIVARFRDPRRSSCGGSCGCASSRSSVGSSFGSSRPQGVEFVGQFDAKKGSR